MKLGSTTEKSEQFNTYFSFRADKQPQELILNDPATLKNAIFNENTNFKFIVHGYTQSKDTPMMAKLREGKTSPINLLISKNTP